MTSPDRASAVGFRLPPTLLFWVAPAAVALGVALLSQHRIEYVIAGAVGLLLFVWAVRHPGPSLSILVAVVALQGVGFGFLYAAHVPGFALRAGGSLKDLLGLGILGSAVLNVARTGRRLGRLEKWALVYVAVVTAYLVLPALFAPDSPHRWSVRLISWRLDAGYPLLFIALRHAPISRRARSWFSGTVVAIGALAGAFAIWQWIAPSAFYRFIVNTGKQVNYERNVLHSSWESIQSTLQYLTVSGSHRHLGSIFLSPFDMADFLLIVVAVIAERLVRGDRRPVLLGLFALVVVALFASQVRADAVAALVIFFVALVPVIGRPVLARWGFVLMLAIGAAIVVPSVGGTHFIGGQNSGSSTTGHIRELNAGLSQLTQTPLGQGLGNNPVSANRFISPGSGAFTSDDSYLQVGDELGLLAMVPWLIFVFGCLVALFRRARSPSPTPAVAALALLGVLVSGLFHHVFLNFSTAWTLWALVGLGLNADGDVPVGSRGHAPMLTRPA